MRHGGKRAKAGRPALGRIPKYVYLSPESVDFLDEKTKGVKTLGEVIDKALGVLKLIS